MTSALSAGATPEDADVVFSLAVDNGRTEVARGAFSLRDLVSERADAAAESVRLEPAGVLAGGPAPAAELVINVKGWRAVAALT